MLRASLTSSRRLVVVLSAAHAIACAALVPLALNVAVKTAVAAAVAASLIRALQRHALLKSRSSIIAIELKSGRCALVQLRSGEWLAAQVLDTTYVMPALTVVNVRLSGDRWTRHVIVVPDNMDRDDFRALRVMLRWSHAGPPKAAGDPP